MLKSHLFFNCALNPFFFCLGLYRHHTPVGRSLFISECFKFPAVENFFDSQLFSLFWLFFHRTERWSFGGNKRRILSCICCRNFRHLLRQCGVCHGMWWGTFLLWQRVTTRSANRLVRISWTALSILGWFFLNLGPGVFDSGWWWVWALGPLQGQPERPQGDVWSTLGLGLGKLSLLEVAPEASEWFLECVLFLTAKGFYCMFLRFFF